MSVSASIVPKRIYIASGLENAPAVCRLRDALVKAGHFITYDWTTHGRVAGERRVLWRIAVNELEIGVSGADVVLVLLPGGLGTHTEMGFALAKGIPVVLCATSEHAPLFDSHHPRTTMGYHHPLVLHQVVADSTREMVDHLLPLLAALPSQGAVHEALVHAGGSVHDHPP